MRRLTIVLATTILLIPAGCGQLVRATRDFELNQPWTDYKRVEVELRNGNVELRSADVPDIRISGRKYVSGMTLAEAEEDLSKIEVRAAARPDSTDTFRVELSYPEELRYKNVGAEVVVHVPQPCAASVQTTNGRIRVEGLAGNVQLETTNGRIVAADVEGAVLAETSNGRVEARNIAGDLTATTSNGNIVARTVQGRCDLGTSNGSVQAEDVQGELRAKTSNGSIRASATPPPNGKVDLRTSNGSIHATLPTALAAEYELSTTNGRINVSLGEAVMKLIETSRRRFHATVNGGGGAVFAQTSNGSIAVDGK